MDTSQLGAGSSVNATGQLEELLVHIYGVIAEAKTMPLGSNVMVNRAELLSLLETVMQSLPDQMNQARWVLKQREQILAKAQVDATALVDDARSRVAHMVERAEVVRQAERRARQLIDDATAHASRQRLQVEDYCEQTLQQFDHALSHIHEQVESVRAALAPRPLSEAEVEPATQQAEPEPTRPHRTIHRPEGGVPTAGPGVIFDQDKV